MLKKLDFLLNRRVAIASLILAVFLLCVYIQPIYVGSFRSDMSAHVDMARAAFYGARDWPIHILYFLLISITAFGSSHGGPWLFSALLWVTIFTVGKMLASMWFMQALAPQPLLASRKKWLLLLAIAMLFVMNLPPISGIEQGFWYRHSFAPNAWHNSTIIALMPFAIVAFVLGDQYIRHTNKKNLRNLLIALLLSALAKPSYLMAWLPSYGVVAFFRNRPWKVWLLSLLPVFLGGAFLLAQTLVAFEVGSTEVGGLVISPLETWCSSAGRTAWGFLQSALFSFLFPIVFYVTHSDRLRSALHLQAIGMCLVSLLFAALLVETGYVQHGNFLWSSMSSNYILTMLCAAELFLWGAPQARRMQFLLPAGIFAAQLLFGMLYLVRYMITGNYF